MACFSTGNNDTTSPKLPANDTGNPYTPKGVLLIIQWNGGMEQWN